MLVTAGWDPFSRPVARLQPRLGGFLPGLRCVSIPMVRGATVA